MQKDPSRRRFPLPDRVIEVIDDTMTGEVLLDEALKMMKSSEKMSVSSWIDLMSGTRPPLDIPTQRCNSGISKPLSVARTSLLTKYRRIQARHGT